MELSFKDLKKRDVINVSDGRCLGNIVNLMIDFPEGILSGIMVPGKRNRGFLGWFNKTEMFIDVSRIIKIGNDVILVDLKCGDVCAPSTRVRRPNPPRPPCPPRPGNDKCSSNKLPSCDELFRDDIGGRGVEIDTDDY